MGRSGSTDWPREIGDTVISLEPVTGKEIYKYVSIFALALEKAAPPFIKITNVKKSNVLKAIRKGDLMGWAVYEGGSLVAVAITKIVEDLCLETRELLIYCVYAWQKLSLEVWDEAFRQMAMFGLSQGCTTMTAYTCVDKVKQMAVRMNGNADMVYLNIPLKGE